MTIPKRAIELSIEGGWKPEWAIGISMERFLNLVEMSWCTVALDREFWICLGKALGMDKQVLRAPYRDYNTSDPLIDLALTFYHLILIGCDGKCAKDECMCISEFWDDLLANK